MPRLPRIKVEGAVYYVTSRAIQSEGIFKDKEDYKMYLDLVKKYKGQHKFKLFSYCLLPDRLELLIETGDDATISEIMHDLNSLYTKYFNGRYQKRGHLFESRFRSVLVEKAQYLAALTRHIHRAAPGFQEFPYSSFHIYKGLPSDAPDVRTEMAEVIEFLRHKDETDSYEKYVLDGDPKEMADLGKRLGRGQVLGSETFQETVKKRVEEHVEELKEAAKPIGPSRRTLIFIGGFVLVVSAASAYLYVSKAKVQTQYSQLLKEKEAEFAEKSKFENRSPLALTELDGTAWQVDLVQLPAEASKETQSDTLHFADGRVWSERAAARGFKAARYTMLVRPGSVTTWETQMTDGRGNTITWRGDWRGDVMKGVSRMALAGKEPQVFSFYSVGWNFSAQTAAPAEGGLQ
jgi:REP element-mobilizing transposase RayT